MWLPTDIVSEIERFVRVYYVDRTMATRWNEHRSKDELRLLTGWAWVTKDGKHHRQGFKTPTVCLRDAWYSVVQKTEAPPITAKPRLRLVRKSDSAKRDAA